VSKRPGRGGLSGTSRSRINSRVRDVPERWLGTSLRYVDRGKCPVVFAGNEPDTAYKLPMAPRYPPAVGEVRARTRLRIQLLRNHRTIRQSADILGRVAKTAPCGLEQFFPETEVNQLERARLIVGRSHFGYSGFALRQARVEDFFHRDTPLDSFDGSELVGVVTGLWCQGVGMASVADTWGRKNWRPNASGQVRLIDTSHLAEDISQVEARVVSRANHDLQDLQDKTIEQGVGSKEQVCTYFATLARDLTPSACTRSGDPL